MVEDDWILSRAVTKTLEEAGYDVVDGGHTVDDALAAADLTKPDLALVGLALRDGTDGVSVAATLRALCGVPSVLISTPMDAPTLVRISDSGVVGVILKPFQESQLLATVSTLLRRSALSSNDVRVDADGRPALSGSSSMKVGRQDQRFHQVLLSLEYERGGVSTDRLTARELDVVRGLLSNGRVMTIAEDLEISPYTVRNHLRSIFRKLGVHSQQELIRELMARMPNK